MEENKLNDLEIWKDIPNYEELYQESNLGRIKNKKNHIISIWDNGKYCYVTLYKDKIRKNCLVHRLVAETFIPNPDNLPQVNHKDENKANNKIENLEWIQPQLWNL